MLLGYDAYKSCESGDADLAGLVKKSWCLFSEESHVLISEGSLFCIFRIKTTLPSTIKKRPFGCANSLWRVLDFEYLLLSDSVLDSCHALSYTNLFLGLGESCFLLFVESLI